MTGVPAAESGRFVLPSAGTLLRAAPLPPAEPAARPLQPVYAAGALPPFGAFIPQPLAHPVRPPPYGTSAATHLPAPPAHTLPSARPQPYAPGGMGMGMGMGTGMGMGMGYGGQRAAMPLFVPGIAPTVPAHRVPVSLDMFAARSAFDMAAAPVPAPASAGPAVVAVVASAPGRQIGGSEADSAAGSAETGSSSSSSAVRSRNAESDGDKQE
jgi:hypothetical protein